MPLPCRERITRTVRDSATLSMSDVESNPHCDLCLNYDGQEGSRCTYVVALIVSESTSVTEKVGDGFNVTTIGVKDAARVKDAANTENVGNPTGNSTVVCCIVDVLPGLRVDPPRGKPPCCAICLSTKGRRGPAHLQVGTHRA